MLAARHSQNNATQRSGSLKAAGGATLQKTKPLGHDATVPLRSTAPTLKLPPPGIKRSHGASLGGGAAAQWEDASELNNETRKLASLAGRVQSMSTYIAGEQSARQRVNHLMDDMHNDELQKVREVNAELDTSMAELKTFVEEFKQKYTAELNKTFGTLHDELEAAMSQLLPRIDSLERRAAALRAGLQEERAERERECQQALGPVKTMLSGLEADLDRERQIREGRNAEVLHQLENASKGLDAAMDGDRAAREYKQAGTQEDIEAEVSKLQQRQEQYLEKVCPELVAEVSQEVASERAARMNDQDPIISAITTFVREFHVDTKEKAAM